MPYGKIGGINAIQLEQGFSFENSNPCNMITLDNIVMLCDNVVVSGVYVKDSVFLTLTDEIMYPENEVKIPVVVYTDSNYEIDILTINSDGEMSINNSFYNCTIKLNGLCWESNSKYYKPEIGNIYPQYFTMDMSEV